MPLVFKDEKREPIVITHDDVKLFFEINPGKRRQARINLMILGGRDFGAACNETLRTTLVGWEGVVDGDGKPIPFSIPVRNWIVDESEIITDDDTLEIIGVAPEKKTEASTSTEL